MRTLSSYLSGRDNNFNLIRLLAALAVLVSHSFALALGRGAREPLSEWVGMSSGSIAVDVFFITSGLLVTASLVRRRSLLEFARARVMRIFPALWVMLALTVLVVGPLLSTLGAKAYLSSPATWHYLVKGATLFDNVAFHLPGVFAQNRYPDAVNGSLWSLPVEVRMYLVIALLWLLCGIARRWHSRLFSTACIAIVLTAGGLVLATHLQGLRDSAALRLIFMFFSGATFFVLRDFLRISRLAFALSTAALLGATFAGHQVFFVAYLLALPYLVVFLAYVPAGGIRRFNRLGDYSYGVYIYAFPVQQVIVALQPGVSVAVLLLQAAAVALVLAGLSWHLVEKRTLASPRPNSPLPATADVVVTHSTANRADELGAPARAIAETTPT